MSPATGGAPALEPRRIVVLRHGQTEDNAAGVWQGHRDSALSEVGRAQAERVAPVLAALDPQLVVSSDLQRASATAGAVADLLGVKVDLDERLREVDVGQWQGRTSAQVREDDADLLAALGRGEDVRRGHTGETVAELALRARAALEDVVARLELGRVALVVCHGWTSRAAVASLVGLDQMLAGRVLWGLDNCHWATVAEARQVGGAEVGPTWRIDHWNVGVRDAPGRTAPGH
ncbi:MAG: histidine phosphatase family protein [Actinomycetota bacterium]|nr:histidine phosphatase family protein [Actinomycetota bacterium]